MAGFVKLMSGENLPDDSPYKEFELIAFGAGDRVFFNKDEDGFDQCMVIFKDDTSMKRKMYGNVYIMSESGKTIASRGTNVPSDYVANSQIR